MNEIIAMTDDAIALADSDGNPAEAKRLADEAREVNRLLEDIRKARDFDKEVRAQFAADRRYARGDSSFEVSVNLIGCYIDVMTSFLYARDPDVSARPRAQVSGQPRKAPKPPMAPPPEMLALDPEAGARFMQEQATYTAELQQFLAERDERNAKASERKRFAETLEIVISSLWQQGRMKPQAQRCVRSALTVGIGWLKVCWLERTGQDPVVLGKMADLQDNMARLHATQDELIRATGYDRERLLSDLEEQYKGLQANVEVVISRGLSIDLVAAEDITVAISVPSILEYRDAPWIDHRIFLRYEDAAAQFPDVPEDKLKAATKYGQRQPKRVQKEIPDVDVAVSADSAEMFTVGDHQPGGVNGSEAPEFVCVHEQWNRDKNLIYTVIEGVDRYARQPMPPAVATSRFYSFFGLAFTNVDGERYPQSKTSRSIKLQDEFNRTRSNFAEHRRRSLPGIIFDKSLLEVSGAEALQKSVTQELIGLESSDPTIPLGNLFTPKPVSPIDGGLYTTDPIRRDLEDIWGVQQALQGSISQPKTATEAQIQQQGFGARTDSDRDAIDEFLSDIAHYTAEVSVQALDAPAVQQIAGPEFIWPVNATVDDLRMLVDVRIRAGSSGKPDTSSDRQAWSQTLPLLQSLVMQVGQFRNASPDEMADKLEELGRITLTRSGDAIDIDLVMPQGDGVPPPPAPPAGPAVGGPPAA